MLAVGLKGDGLGVIDLKRNISLQKTAKEIQGLYISRFIILFLKLSV